MLNIEKIPFSYFGSYFVVSYYKDEGLFIRDIRNGDKGLGKIFKVIPLDLSGKSIWYSCSMQEYVLKIFNSGKKQIAQFCFANENILYLYSQENFQLQLEFILQKYDHMNCIIDKKSYELHSYSQEVKMSLHAKKGGITGELPWHRVGNTSAVLCLNPKTELAIESYTVVPGGKNHGEFKHYLSNSKIIYEKYKEKIPVVSAEYCSVRDAASYILFANTVKPEGLLNKYAVYMSNNCMTNIWSWDHVFTSLALLQNQVKFAYEQFIYFKDFQQDSGVFPDFVNNQYMSFSCCKPPIHGFIYQILMRENEYFCEPYRLLEVYEMLNNLALYWEKYRKYNGLYFYNHGNDSGWDNATIFAEGCPVITADLAAHMIALHDALAEIAELHPKCQSFGAKHRSKAKEIAQCLVQQLWNREYFVSQKLTGEIINARHCLLSCMPITVAKYLPRDICDKLLQALQDPEQFTQFGFATERLDSPMYESNGYWRGPIWAPSSFLLIAGLVRYGHGKLAQEAAKRFCNLCKVGGLAENFDAQTGEGLEDQAFAWTSSVFLFLANKLHTGNWFCEQKSQF